MRLALAAALAFALLAAYAPVASAATVSAQRHGTTSDGKSTTQHLLISYIADAGEVNQPTIVSDGREARVTDTGAPLTAGSGCRPDGADVVCGSQTAYGTAFDQATVDLGDGNDSAVVRVPYGTLNAGPGNDDVRAGGLTLDGGPGADRLDGTERLVYSNRDAGVRVTRNGVADDGEPGEGDDVVGAFRTVVGGRGPDELHATGPGFPGVEGGAGNDTIVGTAGNDQLVGGDGDDSIDGGDGNDRLTGGPGGDVLRGSGGRDTVDYFRAAGPLTVRLDGSGGDGAPGEGDDVRDDVEDVSAAETTGDHVLTGSAAANTLEGGAGDDRIEGGAGDDRLDAGGGANHLVGGAGRDLLLAYSIFAGEPDRVDARDGERDRVVCGEDGSDVLDVDRFDVTSGCAPVVSAAWRGSVRATRAGTLGLPVRCPKVAQVACAGRLSLREDALAPRTGVGEFSGIEPGRVGRVRIRLKPELLRLLVRERTFVMLVTVTARRTTPSSTGEGFERVRVRAPR